MTRCPMPLGGYNRDRVLPYLSEYEHMIAMRIFSGLSDCTQATVGLSADSAVQIVQQGDNIWFKTSLMKMTLPISGRTRLQNTNRGRCLARKCVVRKAVGVRVARENQNNHSYEQGKVEHVPGKT